MFYNKTHISAAKNNYSIPAKRLTILRATDPIHVCLAASRVAVRREEANLLIITIDTMCITDNARSLRIRDRSKLREAGTHWNWWRDADDTIGGACRRYVRSAVGRKE